MFGRLDREENRRLTDLRGREWAYLLPLVILAFWIGVRPGPIFRVLDDPIRRLVQQVEKTYPYPSLVKAPETPEPAPGTSPASLTGLIE